MGVVQLGVVQLGVVQMGIVQLGVVQVQLGSVQMGVVQLGVVQLGIVQMGVDPKTELTACKFSWHEELHKIQSSLQRILSLLSQSMLEEKNLFT